MTLFKSKTASHTAFGIAFGFLFPVLSTMIESYLQYGAVSIETIFAVQATTPLLWVIDSAPFFLGLFASFSGIKQDRLHAANERLVQEIRTRTEFEAQLRKHNELLQDDLEYARILQLSFLPELPENELAVFDYRYLPVKAVGGDLVSIVEIREGGYGIFIGDVAGHGVSASLITALVKVVSDRACRKYGMMPSQYLAKLNHELLTVIPEGNYLTALYGVLHAHNGSMEFTFSRAGHPHPIIWKRSAGKALLLRSEGVPVCHADDSAYREHTITLETGDRIFLYTDGVYEVKHDTRGTLGMAGLIDIIESVHLTPLPVGMTLDAIIDETVRFSHGTPIRDDRILVGIEIR